jgi:hypothetical protein
MFMKHIKGGTSYRSFGNLWSKSKVLRGTKMTAFWDVVPRSLVEVDRCLRDVYCHYRQGDDRWLSSSYSPP